MNQERMAILKMLEEGKISAQEAERLLRAVGGPSQGEGPGLDELGKKIGQVMQEAGRTISEAVGAARRSSAGRAFGEMVDDVVSEFSGSGEEIEETREWTLEAAGVALLQADTSNGAIEVEGSALEEIQVRATKKVKARTLQQAEECAAQVEVHAQREGDVVRIWEERPRNLRGIRVEVRYQVRCPRQLALRLSTLNGAVSARGTQAGIEASTLNGKVEVRESQGRMKLHSKNGKVAAHLALLSGRGEFETANGKVEVVVRAGQGPIDAKTLNGAVELSLPANFAGRLDASTVHGHVHSEFPIPVVGKPDKTRLEGEIGPGGEHLVRLRTVNGAISLKKSAPEP
jgi:DUF4097 and DUF4098 domain-containing protein YvlB